MILRTPRPLRNIAAADDAPIAPDDDPRLILFRDLLRAIKVGDARAGMVATKKLREHNISVCLLPARGQGATR